MRIRSLLYVPVSSERFFPAPPRHRDRPAQPFPRRVLAGRRDRILEVKNEGIGAALVGLGKKPLGAHRNVQQRSDAQWQLLKDWIKLVQDRA